MNMKNVVINFKAEEIDDRIMERINGELLYLNGASLLSSTIMNKSVSVS